MSLTLTKKRQRFNQLAANAAETRENMTTETTETTTTTTTIETRIRSPYNIGKISDDEGGRFAMAHVRAYVGATLEAGKPAPAVLVATNGKSLVVAHARAFGDDAQLPYATMIPAPALACAIKSRDKVRELSVSTEPNRVTAIQDDQPIHVITGTDLAYVPWRNVCSGIIKGGKDCVSVTLSADLLRDLLDSMNDRSGGKHARAQTIRLTFQPDKNGNADQAILVTSDSAGSGEPSAALLMPCTRDDSSAASHAARVAKIFDDAIAIASRTGAPEMQ